MPDIMSSDSADRVPDRVPDGARQSPTEPRQSPTEPTEPTARAQMRTQVVPCAQIRYKGHVRTSLLVSSDTPFSPEER
eukprot:2693613-Prymnesium_polylepis.1